jgi:hypothetical protein
MILISSFGENLTETISNVALELAKKERVIIVTWTDAAFRGHFTDYKLTIHGESLNALSQGWSETPDRKSLEYLHAKTSEELGDHSERLLDGTARIARISRWLMDYFRPDKMLIWGKHNAIARCWADISLHSAPKTVYFERGWLPGLVQVCENGCNAEIQVPYIVSVSDKSKAMAEEFVRKSLESRVSNHAQPERLTDVRKDIDAQGKKIVLFIGQVAHDTQILAQSSLGWDYGQVYDMLGKVFNGNDRCKLVIKPHPMDQFSVLHNKMANVHAEVLHDCNIHDAIRAADVVLTVNSTAGYEALLHGKPVISLCGGKSFYHRLAHHCYIAEELEFGVEHFRPSGKERELATALLAGAIESGVVCREEDMTATVKAAFERIKR